MKRDPLLVDEILASKIMGHHNGPGWEDEAKAVKKLEERLRDELLVAKRYVFDSQAIAYLGELIAETPELIAHAQEFAIPPFQKMWVEMDFPPLYRRITGKEPDKYHGDKKLGFLYLGNRVYVYASDANAPGLCTVYYDLNYPWSETKEKEMFEVLGGSDPKIANMIDLFYWGTPAGKLLSPGPWAFDDVKEHTPEFSMLRANNSMGFIVKHPVLQRAALENNMQSSAGDLRTIIAILLLLNRSSEVTYEDAVKPLKRMWKAKSRTFLGHSVIKFKLNPMPKIKKIFKDKDEGGNWRKLHDVRGHFCVDRASHEGEKTACRVTHDWVELDVQYWRCSRCNGAKWWRKSHTRGNAENGLKFGHYDVTR